jgi:hypothetical protein
MATTQTLRNNLHLLGVFAATVSQLDGLVQKKWLFKKRRVLNS